MSTAAIDAGSSQKGNKKKLMLIVVGVLVLLLVAGAAAMMFLSKKAHSEDGDDDAAPVSHTSSKGGHRTPPTFVALESFTVNLADKDVERYAQIGVTLEVDDPKFAEDMKAYMPSIRNNILMILAHKTSTELLDRAGKEALAAEIMRESVRPLGIEIDDEDSADDDTTSKKKKRRKAEVHNPVTHVNFSNFIIQ
ncbi:MAG: fliL [Rhizobacter sp.]|nr:fliL [Rhizobacter sp.]